MVAPKDPQVPPLCRGCDRQRADMRRFEPKAPLTVQEQGPCIRSTGVVQRRVEGAPEAGERSPLRTFSSPLECRGRSGPRTSRASRYRPIQDGGPISGGPHLDRGHRRGPPRRSPRGPHSPPPGRGAGGNARRRPKRSLHGFRSDQRAHTRHLVSCGTRRCQRGHPSRRDCRHRPPPRRSARTSLPGAHRSGLGLRSATQRRRHGAVAPGGRTDRPSGSAFPCHCPRVDPRSARAGRSATPSRASEAWLAAPESPPEATDAKLWIDPTPATSCTSLSAPHRPRPEPQKSSSWPLT